MAGVDDEVAAVSRAAAAAAAAEEEDEKGERDEAIRMSSSYGSSTPVDGEWLALEVGFNAGHSAALLLATFPRASLRSFDLCAHVYTKSNAAWLQTQFEASNINRFNGTYPRFALSCGNSRETLPAAAELVPLQLLFPICEDAQIEASLVLT
jgi:hypothetical protein